MSVLRRLVESRSSTTPVADAVRARRDPVSLDVTPDVALQHAAVFACVRLIAEGVAALPAHAFRPSPDGDARLRVSPQPQILTAPHRDLTAFEWRRQILVSMLMRGNGFAWIDGTGRDGWPLSATPLDPGTVTLRSRGDGWEWAVNGRPAQLHTAGGSLVHFPAFQVPGSPLGLSPLQVSAQTVGVGLQAERFAGRWFIDGAAPSSVLESETQIDDEQARRLQARWMAAHGSGSRFPAVLSGGVTWKPVTITPEESQFLQTQQFSVAQIARLFGVPPHMIGDTERSTSWGSGIEQQHIGYLTHTLGPWLQMIDGRMSTLIPRGQYVRSSTASLLRADSMSRFQSYVQARMAGWLSVNEIRALEEMPPVPDGDGYLQPLNMGPLGVDPLTTPRSSDVSA
jgi:HK97 family phage portal protein